MKIKDWENYVSNKYNIIEKTRDFERIQDFIIDYHNDNKEFYFAIKKDNFIIYVIKDDDEFNILHYRYELPEEQKYMMDLTMEYIELNQNQPFNLDRQIDFYLSKGFEKKSLEELSEKEKEYYYDSYKFSIQSLTEGYISDDEFYMAYIFDDIEIFKNGVRKYNSGFSNTMVFIASNDGENISDYFVHWGGFCEPKEFEKFLIDIDTKKDN